MELNLDWRREQSARLGAVSYEIRPLKVWAFQELMAFWESQPRETADGQSRVRISPAQSLHLVDLARRIFPDHVRNLSGIALRRDGASAPAAPLDLCDEAPLLELAGEVLGRLVAISELNPGDEKN
jgi:hypothetical protein